MSHLAKLLLRIAPVVVPGGTPVIGEEFGGGYFVGQLTISGSVYNIIVAPRVGGQPGVSLRYKSSTSAFSGAASTNDGILIRNNMIAEGISNFPMQEWCNNLTIGGHTDWVLPPKDWMELAYRNLKPTTANNVTNTGKNTSAIPPITTNYTTTDPSQTSVLLYRTGGAQTFGGNYFSTATTGASSGTMFLKRMSTGADYSEEYQYDQIFRAFRCELAA